MAAFDPLQTLETSLIVVRVKCLGFIRMGVPVLLVFTFLACSPAKQTPPQAKPQRDEVRFFERPATLAAIRKSGEAVPALVLMETDPWAAVIGSDSPTVALYEDGTIIWRTGTAFRTTHLNRAELERLYTKLNPDALRPFYGRYDVAPMTDQPDEDLVVYRGDKPTFISVYGSLKSPEVRAKIPSEIVAAYDTLKDLNLPSSAEWLPPKFEIMVWPYEYAPDASIDWPKDLPDLKDGSTVKRGDSFSIYVPSSQLQEVRAFLAHRTEKGAIQIDGKKWAAAIRFPFPAERLWMAPNTEIKEGKD